jgi:hypothetical protein
LLPSGAAVAAAHRRRREPRGSEPTERRVLLARLHFGPGQQRGSLEVPPLILLLLLLRRNLLKLLSRRSKMVRGPESQQVVRKRIAWRGSASPAARAVTLPGRLHHHLRRSPATAAPEPLGYCRSRRGRMEGAVKGGGPRLGEWGEEGRGGGCGGRRRRCRPEGVVPVGRGPVVAEAGPGPGLPRRRSPPPCADPSASLKLLLPHLLLLLLLLESRACQPVECTLLAARCRSPPGASLALNRAARHAPVEQSRPAPRLPFALLLLWLLAQVPLQLLGVQVVVVLLLEASQGGQLLPGRLMHHRIGALWGGMLRFEGPSALCKIRTGIENLQRGGWGGKLKGRGEKAGVWRRVSGDGWAADEGQSWEMGKRCGAIGEGGVQCLS